MKCIINITHLNIYLFLKLSSEYKLGTQLLKKQISYNIFCQIKDFYIYKSYTYCIFGLPSYIH